MSLALALMCQVALTVTDSDAQRAADVRTQAEGAIAAHGWTLAAPDARNVDLRLDVTIDACDCKPYPNAAYGGMRMHRSQIVSAIAGRPVGEERCPCEAGRSDAIPAASGARTAAKARWHTDGRTALMTAVNAALGAHAQQFPAALTIDVVPTGAWIVATGPRGREYSGPSPLVVPCLAPRVKLHVVSTLMSYGPYDRQVEAPQTGPRVESIALEKIIDLPPPPPQDERLARAIALVLVGVLLIVGAAYAWRAIRRWRWRRARASPGAPAAEVTFDVFLAHNSKDKPTARELKRRLGQATLQAWLDEDEVPPGLRITEVLEAGLRSSRTFAILVGARGIGPWQREEINAILVLAVELDRPVIPVLLPDAPAGLELPVFLAGRAWIDLRAGLDDAAVGRLIRGIPPRNPPPEPLPPGE